MSLQLGNKLVGGSREGLIDLVSLPSSWVLD